MTPTPLAPGCYLSGGRSIPAHSLGKRLTCWSWVDATRRGPVVGSAVLEELQTVSLKAAESFKAWHCGST